MMKTARSFKMKNKGQSFVELALLMSTLLLLVTGLIEFGNMLNQYVNLVDGAREGARYGSNLDPFFNETTSADDYTVDPQTSFYNHVDFIIEGNLTADPTIRTSSLSPLFLDRHPEDQPGFRDPTGVAYKRTDILITVYSVSQGAILHKWPTWHAYPGSGQVSQIQDSVVTGQLNSVAPNTGIVLVEIFYNYFQLLKLPFFTAVIADPIPLHAYAFMPLAGAEPTPTP